MIHWQTLFFSIKTEGKKKGKDDKTAVPGINTEMPVPTVRSTKKSQLYRINTRIAQFIGDKPDKKNKFNYKWNWD